MGSNTTAISRRRTRQTARGNEPGKQTPNGGPTQSEDSQCAEPLARDEDIAQSKMADMVAHMIRELLPQCFAVAAMLSLIFGGCCSNVYALESIIQVEPASGTLLTSVQFLFVAVTGYISQFDISRPPFYIRPNKVPLSRWLINIVLFFSINVMNNHAFSYDISVPVHIILRSGGSITTIAAGYLYGKRYSRIQVVAVILLTIGVITAAWADAQAKTQGQGKNQSGLSRPTFGTGLVILFVAQTLSAVMGIYTEETYKTYGPHWRENLFYSHLLSLPLFLPFMGSLIDQFKRLARSPPLGWPEGTQSLVPQLGGEGRAFLGGVYVPIQLVYLAANVLTQYACIRGVNLLAAASSALTVTIVLNIRKLVSLLLSIWLFGNKLAAGTLVGAVVVFGAGALYSLDSKPKPKSSPDGTPDGKPRAPGYKSRK